jgi:ATP-dependent DNA helicase RecG
MTEDADRDAAAMLATPVQFLKGVGPQRAELLRRLNLKAAKDLLFFFPRDYYDASRVCAISQLQENEPVSVCGVVEEVEVRNTGPGRSLLGVLIRQDHDYLRALWFNQPYMRERFARGSRVLLAGTPRFSGGRWEMAHPRVEPLGEDEDPPAGKVLPVYGLTEGIRQTDMRRVVGKAVETYGHLVDEVFPETFLARYDLLPIGDALHEIHAPKDRAGIERARRRFVFQELLVLQLALALRRQQLALHGHAPSLPATTKIDARIRRLFRFDLTPDQNRAIGEIAADLARTQPMNRLLQGDVGSGKTVVAEYAMLVAVAHGRQAVLMAPTEVLARQHYQTLTRDLQRSRVRIELLTGSCTAAQRREILGRIASGDAALIVGTHALLREEIALAKLGLVVIDEQHKFGVAQRAALRRAGVDPHYLVMTATPIPRTVSMTAFGDLDASVLREGPPGRALVHTYLGIEAERERWWDFFRRKLCEGRQGYVVSPFVQSTEREDNANVQQAFEALSNGQLADFRLDLIHGRMNAAEKEAAMRDFQSGKTQVLVATSVVEVGVDVPNATLMTVEGGERFGLAQLHQLRGRISRGPHAGYLCVFADTQTESSRQRLEAFCQCNDGFELAELDLRLRGPGCLFSLQQHGLPPFYIADLVRDGQVLLEAREAARQLVSDGTLLGSEACRKLRAMVTRRYGKTLDLLDVG